MFQNIYKEKCPDNYDKLINRKFFAGNIQRVPMKLPFINENIQLEQICVEHTEEFFDAVSISAASISKWLNEYFAPNTPESVAAFIAEWEQSWESGLKYGLCARETIGNRLIGFGLLNQINYTHRFANLGYWIRSDATGQGYATALTRALARFGFEMLGLIRIELVIEPKNIASRRVAEKAGGLCEGLLRNRLTVNGKARNALMFSLIHDK